MISGQLNWHNAERLFNEIWQNGDYAEYSFQLTSQGPSQRSKRGFSFFFFFIVYRRWSISLNHHFSVDFEFFWIVHILFLIREFGGLWLWIGTVHVGKGRAYGPRSVLVGSVLGTWGLLLIGLMEKSHQPWRRSSHTFVWLLCHPSLAQQTCF